MDISQSETSTEPLHPAAVHLRDQRGQSQPGVDGVAFGASTGVDVKMVGNPRKAIENLGKP